MVGLKKESVRFDNLRESRSGAMLFAYVFAAMTILLIIQYGISQHSSLDQTIIRSHAHDLQSTLAAQSGLEYGLLSLRHNQASGTALCEDEIFVHSFGLPYGGKNRYSSSFRLATEPIGLPFAVRAPYLFVASASTVAGTFVVASPYLGTYLGSITMPVASYPTLADFLASGTALIYLSAGASNTSFVASACRLVSTGRVYELTNPAFGNYSSNTLAVTTIERVCIYNASPALAIFASRTYDLR